MEPGITTVLTTTLVVLVATLALIAIGQRRLIYQPDSARVAPAVEGLRNVAEVELPTPDGERLVAWYAPAADRRLTALYFHGNAAGLRDRAARIRMLQSEGYGIFMLAYRGYAGSTGSPSEAANLADARLAYNWLMANGGKPERTVLIGESLGTGVAVPLAAQVPAAGLLLDSPFTSLADVAAVHFPYLPVRLLLRDRYPSIDHIGRVQVPLLIIHGEQDRVVPFALGKRLFEAANEPKRHVAFPGVGHLVPFEGRGWPTIRAFLAEIEQVNRHPTLRNK